MKFGLVNSEKQEAQPGLRGICQFCNGELISKCGKVVIWHWAHKSKASCDPWWENETEWHRAWKDRFPKEWQEVIHSDPITGERHIADVKTPYGLVIEFQHSAMSPEERISREKFYGNMIWIVDGRRNEADADNFRIGLDGEIQSDPIAWRIRWWSRSRILHNWSPAGAKVFLDFGPGAFKGDILWQLVLFDGKKSMGVVGPLFRQSLTEDCINGKSPFRIMYRNLDAKE
jgi:competence protein CoiA